MKANELMIGDWVYMKSHRGFESQNIKVETIPDASSDNHYGHIGAYPISEDMDFRDIEDSHLEPIPLTEEILKKNGMRNGYEAYYVSYSQNDKSWYFVYDSDSCSLNVLISNVHELQHVLRLCGINKEIVL